MVKKSVFNLQFHHIFGDDGVVGDLNVGDLNVGGSGSGGGSGNLVKIRQRLKIDKVPSSC